MRSSARKSGIPRPVSASTTAASATPAKWWPFATICVPTRTARSAAANAPQHLGDRAGLRDRVGVEAEALELREVRLELPLQALRAGADPRELRRAAGRARLRPRLRVAAVVAVEPSVAVEDERDVAVRAADRQPAGAAVQRRGEPAPVEEQDRLAAVVADAAERLEQRRRQRVAGLAPEVDDLHRRQRAREPAAELDPLEPRPALRPRRGRAVHRDRALQRRPLRRDRARVVARVAVLLVRRVVLLVDDDEAEARARARRPPTARR